MAPLWDGVSFGLDAEEVGLYASAVEGASLFGGSSGLGELWALVVEEALLEGSSMDFHGFLVPTNGGRWCGCHVGL